MSELSEEDSVCERLDLSRRNVYSGCVSDGQSTQINGTINTIQTINCHGPSPTFIIKQNIFFMISEGFISNNALKKRDSRQKFDFGALKDELSGDIGGIQHGAEGKYKVTIPRVTGTKRLFLCQKK